MKPEDVQSTRFRESWRGYAEDEVDDFMSRVAHAIQVLTKERDEAVARAERLASESEGLVENERLLRRTLLTAERTAEDTVQRAQMDAERITSEARADAERIRIEAHEQARREIDRAAEIAARVRRSVEEFHAFRAEYTDRLRSVIAEQIAALERVGELPVMPEGVEDFERLDVERGADSVLATGDADAVDDGAPPPPSVLDDDTDEGSDSPGGHAPA
jgi:cell division initiation protein